MLINIFTKNATYKLTTKELLEDEFLPANKTLNEKIEIQKERINSKNGILNLKNAKIDLTQQILRPLIQE